MINYKTSTDEIAKQLGAIHRTLTALRDLNNKNPLAQQRASSLLLLFLSQQGPLKAGELAELAGSDPSTISRHVAKLVTDGMIIRVADQSDGRTSLLQVTSKGDAVCQRMIAIRHEVFAQAMHGWSGDEMSIFQTLLSRFNIGLKTAADLGAADA